MKLMTLFRLAGIVVLTTFLTYFLCGHFVVGLTLRSYHGDRAMLEATCLVNTVGFMVSCLLFCVWDRVTEDYTLEDTWL